MGSLILPSSGPVYADAQIFIYSVEKHPNYAPPLRPLWEAVARGDFEVVSSELTLLETLVGPLKRGDTALETDYENFFVIPGIRLLPITSAILRAGARHRAALSSLRTPDALHAATAGSCGCTLFLTNDVIFRRFPGLPVVILDDVLGP
jgi:predicted nucleic acid-binding protein